MALWDLQASAGAAGQSLLWRGPWNSVSSYNPYDAVYATSGSSYISKTNNQNKDPVSNVADWDLLASVGATGPQGALGGLPVGSIVDYGGLIEPEGWLFCWGQIKPRTGIFASLFEVLGEQFGRGDGVTTFQLPDYRGRVSVAPDNMGGAFANRMTFTRSCNTSTGSTTLTHNSAYWIDTPGITSGTEIPQGAYIFGPGIPAGTTIVQFLGHTTCQMSNAATATTSGATVRFSMLNDLGLNGSGGEDANRLVPVHNPVHTHAYYLWDHSHLTLFPQLIGASGIQGGPHYNWSNVWQNSQGIYGGTGVGWHDSGGTGGDQAHNNTQPTLLANKIIKYTLPGTTATLTPGTGDVSGPSVATDGELAVFNGTSGKFIRRGGMLPSGYRLPRGWLAALKTGNNPVDTVNDIDIQDGECRDSTNTVDIVLLSGMTKQIDAFWSAGTGQGGLDQTQALADRSYHIFVIKNQNTLQVDCLISPSATAPLLPTGFTHFRRIGSIMRKSGVMVRFLQEGDYFYKPAEVDMGVGDTIPGNTSTVKTLQTIPIGIRGHVICSEMAYVNADPAGGGTVTYMAGDVDLGGGAYGPYVDGSANWFQTGYPILFNALGQIRIRAAAPATRMHLSTFGWIDPRGRND